MNGNCDVNKITGLSDNEVKERIRRYGYNELPQSKPRNFFAIAFEVFREPMFLLLVSCGVIYLLLGDKESAIMLLGFVFVVIGITLYQEHKTERALEALRDLSSPRAMVIRNGVQQRIAGREVVLDDIIVINEGDRIPADAALLSSSNIQADESLLTGESMPVRKITWDGKIKNDRPGGDDLPFLYSGTMIVQGQGIARVIASGSDTELGKIGRSLREVETEETLLQKEIKRMVKSVAATAFFICVAVIVIYGLTRADWIKGLLAGLTLAMALLPEEFPVVLTIFLALGAWRLSRRQILTRRVPVVETLGSTTVLCVDKTGTITQNRMAVEKIYAKNDFCDLGGNSDKKIPEIFHETVEFGILASHHQPFDPMEKALLSLGGYKLCDRHQHIHHDWKLIREYPLSKNLLAMSNVWESPAGSDYVIGVKGAPEAIMDLCHLAENEKNYLIGKIGVMAEDGLRILGVAKASFSEDKLPGKQHDFKFEFLGLIGLSDPVRPTVKNAVRECYTAGIRVIMITGDYPATAEKIGTQIGLRSAENIITGAELDKIGDRELESRIKTTNIFARVIPEQKLRIVNALKANGEIVAMTGDGVNDAPALKAAHVGISMGGRGTDVAREASSLVLLDEDFSSIVAAVMTGRRIFDNLRKAMAYILAVHVPIAGMTLLPIFFNWPLVLLPVHIVFLELIIDPACSMVFEQEKEEKDIMTRPPRDIKEPMFGKRLIVLSLIQGIGVFIVSAVVFYTSLRLSGSIDEARALGFTTLIVGNLGLIFTNRSWSRTIFSMFTSKNKALALITVLTVFFLALVLYVPFLRDMFKFSTLHYQDFAVCLFAGIISIAWFEFLKVMNAKDKLSLYGKK